MLHSVGGHTLASFPGLPPFLPLTFTVIHGSGLPLLYIIVNANGTQKQGGLGTRLVYIHAFLFVLVYSLSPIDGQTLVL